MEAEDGSLIQDLDVLNIPSDRRNGILADVFDRLDYMEREGSGFKKIMEDYTAEVAHNTAKVMPKFYSAVGCFVVTLPRLVRGTQSDTQGVTQGVPQDGLSPMDAKIVEYVRRHSKVTTEKLAKLPNVRYVGHGYSGHWVVDEEER